MDSTRYCTEMENANRDTTSNEDFIGFRCDAEVKKRVKREADRRDSTMTEVLVDVVNRQLGTGGDRPTVAA